MRAVVVAVALLLVTSGSAHAGESAAVAEKLFTDARALMAKGRAAEACPLLEESQRLDAGVGTLLNLGECYETIGRTASAWSSYREAMESARRARQPERAAFAQSRADAVAAKLSVLTVRVDVGIRGPGAGPPGDIAELQITRNGERMGAATWGTAIPVDPGQHVIEASKPGRTTVRKVVDVAASSRVTVDIPRLVSDGEPAPAPSGPVPPAPAPAPSPTAGDRPLLDDRPGPDARDAGRTTRAVGYVTLGVGGGALLAGIATGIVAVAQKDAARADHCSAVDCDERGLVLIRGARDMATASTVLVLAGSLVAASGILLVVLAPRATTSSAPGRARAAVGLGGTSLWLGGSF